MMKNSANLSSSVFPVGGIVPAGVLSLSLIHILFRNGFREQDIGYASTIAVVFFLIIVAINLIQRYVVRDREVA